MAKLIVAIPYSVHYGSSVADVKRYIEENKNDYFPVDAKHISIDKTDVPQDPTDDSFLMFELLRIEEE